MTCGRNATEDPADSVFQCAGQTSPNCGRKAREATADVVNHPAHYTAGRIECIDAIESAIDGLSGVEAFLTGQVMKYMHRWPRKNGIEDLRKAKWYLERLIERSLIVKAQKIGPDYEVSE